MGELTHFNEQGRARMVDVTEKAVTHRRAVAAGEIRVSPETMAHIKNGTLKKGDVLAVAQVAGIQAAKHNWELIPMCHPGVDAFLRQQRDLAVPVTGMGVPHDAVAQFQFNFRNGLFQRSLFLTDIDGYDPCHGFISPLAYSLHSCRRIFPAGGCW
mgnify:CR=1 FL=1